ncbi:hypothetical protein PF002_g6967 [Phytophthora fragariae]|uniref:Uncharacterized protein n=2 Tax=Phytophthora fragariae TaxID=53985 RepID=A0A6A4A1P2_9STRA|nr:hypothetical protein PF002_g6967 [Phytophthora fragariae]
MSSSGASAAPSSTAAASAGSSAVPRGEGQPAGSTSRPSRAPGVSGERDSPLIDLTTPQEFDRESEESSRASSPRPPGPHGDTTSGTAGTGQSDSAGQVSLASLQELIRQESQCRRQENGDLARLLSFAFTQPVPPVDRFQRRALLDAQSVTELTHVLRGQYSPLGSAQVIADLRQELGILQTLQGDQAPDWTPKKASPFLTSLRKALAKSEAALKLVQEKQDRKIKSAFKHSADYVQKVKKLEEEVVTLTQALADRDHAYAELHAVSSKHFEQLQESTSLLLTGDSQPLRHAKAVINSQRQVILRQKRVIAREGKIPMHDPHMAAAAGAGLDFPGLNLADLQLNARLCRTLAMRFPEVMDIPAGETRTVELVIHPREDGGASVPQGSLSSAGSSLGLGSPPSGLPSSVGVPVPTGLPSGVSSATSTKSSSRVYAPPSKSIDQLHRARLDTLTPAEKLRWYSNPKSSTAAGSRVKPHVPPPQPYACPLLGEEVHAEAASQLDEAAREVGFPPSSSSLQESGPDSSRPTEFQEFADVDDSSLDFDSFGLQQISLVPYAASPTSSSAPATSPSGSPSRPPHVLNLSRGMAPLSISVELAGVSPVDFVVEPAATSTESGTVTLSAALALPPTAEYPTSVRWVPPESSSSADSVQTSGSAVPSTSTSASSEPTPSSAVARLLACSSQTKSTSSKIRVPSSSSASSTVLTSAPMVSSTSSRPTVPPASVVMTSPSGRLIRAKAATARMISAHCLEVLETPDYVVLCSGHSPGSPDLLDSAGGPSADGTSAHPLSVSDGSSAAGSEYEYGANEGSAGPLSPAPVKSSGKGRLRRARAQSEDEVEDEDEDNVPLSSLRSSSSVPRGKMQSYLQAGRTPPGPPVESGDSGDASGDGSGARLSSKKRKRKHKSKRKHKHQHHHSRRSPSPVPASSTSQPQKPKKRRKGSVDTPVGSGSVSTHASPSPTPTAANSTGPVRILFIDSKAHDRPELQEVLRVPLSRLRTRASQAASRDSRITPQLARLRDLRFVHYGSARCWKAILANQTGQVSMDYSSGKPRVPATRCCLNGIKAFADVYNPNHPAQRLRRLLPDPPFFLSPKALEDARARLANSTKPVGLVEKLAEVFVKIRGEIPDSAGGASNSTRDDHPTRFFVALYERGHWLVESSVMRGLHPACHEGSTYDEVAELHTLWLQYRLARKRRSDALRALMTVLTEDLYSAAMKMLNGLAAPEADAELFFEPSVPFYPLVNLS